MQLEQKDQVISRLTATVASLKAQLRTAAASKTEDDGRTEPKGSALPVNQQLESAAVATAALNQLKISALEGQMLSLQQKCSTLSQSTADCESCIQRVKACIVQADSLCELKERAVHELSEAALTCKNFCNQPAMKPMASLAHFMAEIVSQLVQNDKQLQVTCAYAPCTRLPSLLIRARSFRWNCVNA